MPLTELEIPIDWDALAPDDLSREIQDATFRIRQFQDRWDRKPIEQFVASDFELVYHALNWIQHQSNLLSGNRFCEWGCGFAVVSCLASQLGWDTTAIEAETELYAQAKHTIDSFGVPVDLWHGNFLPSGSGQFADNPSHPSLGHAEPPVYEEMELGLDDFDLIFAYPWPGEGSFLETVFERHAEYGACFLTFCGPYELRLVRKTR